jgi:hypothetical protein
MTHEERRQAWERLKVDIDAGSIILGSTETAGNPFWDRYVRQQQAENYVWRLSIDNIMDAYRSDHPGVDDQGDAVVVEPLALPAPAAREQMKKEAG